MYESMLARVICEEFEKNPGKDQAPIFGEKPGEPKALLIGFRRRIDHDKEDGYRYLDLLLFAPTNYVQVWTRSRANTISLEDMEEDDGEMVPKDGKDYESTKTEWEMHSDHDSCWRDAVGQVLWDNRESIAGFDSINGWAKVIPVPPELGELYKKERKKRGYS